MVTPVCGCGWRPAVPTWIRVHMAYIKHPLVGSRLRRSSALLRNATPELTEAPRAFHRQALHATMLKLAHPSRVK